MAGKLNDIFNWATFSLSNPKDRGERERGLEKGIGKGKGWGNGGKGKRIEDVGGMNCSEKRGCGKGRKRLGKRKRGTGNMSREVGRVGAKGINGKGERGHQFTSLLKN